MKYCKKCQHRFCIDCRGALFWRGVEAVKQFITRRPPKNCHCKETE